MAKYKVTNALVTYKDVNGKRRDAFRGDVIDIPAEVYEANKEAFVGADEELRTPGVLVELIDTPGDEHILQYLNSGTAKEIIPQLSGYTKEVQDRLLVAERKGQARPTLLAALGDPDALNPDASVPPSAAAQSTPTPPPVAPLTETSTEEEVQAYLKIGKADDILAAAASWTPELRERVLEAEKAGKNRVTLTEGLPKLSQ